MAGKPGATDPLARYVNRYATEWEHQTDAKWREVDGSLVYVDISGFTALAERLARRGRIGAEELTDVLNHIFAEMLGLTYQRGGSLLKFGGDALLLLFDGADHAIHACSAAVEMQRALRDAADYQTSAGRLRLRMSVGIHSGSVHLFRAGDSHHELIIAGPAASTTARLEESATAGEILISSETRRALPLQSAIKKKGDGWLLRWRKPRTDPLGVTARTETSAEETSRNVPSGLRSHLRAGRTEPEHHMATVGFVKYSGTDGIIENQGPAAAAAVIDRFISDVQTIVDDEGVTFLASDLDEDGGKIIIVAGVPGVQEDDGGRVLRSTRRIVDAAETSELAVKAGVNQGHVFVGDIGTDFRATYTIMGDTVNLAARLMASASHGEIYSTTTAIEGSRTIFDITQLEPFVVRGKKHPVQAFAVGHRTGSRPRSHGGDLPFMGRVDELVALRALVQALGDGRGSIVSIVGERGVGKSRLADEILAELDGVLHIPIRAEPYGTATPYRPLRDPVRELLGIKRGTPEIMAMLLHRRIKRLAPEALPFLPLVGEVTMIPVPPTPEVERIDPQFRQAKTADLLADLLARVYAGPVLFEVEDGHFMDDASAHGMMRIAEGTDDHPWLVLTTRLPGTGGFEPDGLTIELGPLDESDTRSMVHAATEAAPLRPHEITAVIERSGGLPLYVEEIVRALRATGGLEELPDSLEALVSAQIDGLAPLVRRLLQYASILGLSFRSETLVEFLKPEDVSLDSASRRALRGFLERDGDERLRFRHAMIRDAAYRGLSFKRRRELHGRAGEIARVAAEPHPDSVADVLGLHFSLASNHEGAWRYARIAGDNAAATYSNVDAAVHYRRALSSARRLDHAAALEKAEIWAALGNVTERAGLFDEALAAYRRASRLVNQDPARSIDLLLRRARVRRRSGAYRDALRELTQATRLVELVEGDAAIRAQGRIAAERAAVRRWQQRPRDALEFANVAERSSRTVNDLETLGRALDLAHWANLIAGNTDHPAPYEETLRIYEELEDLGRVAEVWNNRGADAMLAGKWLEAIDAYSEASANDQRCGNEVGSAIADANIAEVLVNQRRFAEAEPMLTKALRVLRASRHAPAIAFAESELARLLLLRGDVDQAITLAQEIRIRAVEAGEALTVLNATLLLAEAKLVAGDHAEARQLIDGASSEGGALLEFFRLTLVRLHALTDAARDRPEEAIVALGAALDEAEDRLALHDHTLLLEARIKVRAEAFGRPDPDDVLALARLDDELAIRREPVHT